MIIMIEGPDGTGKTTLAKELAKRGAIYHYKTRHYNYTKEEMSDMMNDKRVHVLDRGFLTPWVYRIVEYSPLDDVDFSFEYMYECMTSKKLIIIYCNYPYGFQAAQRRGEDGVTDIYTWDKLKSAYDFVVDTIFLFNICPVYRYCWSTDIIDNVMKFIKEDINAV